jgi:hypothetical protein
VHRELSEVRIVQLEDVHQRALAREGTAVRAPEVVAEPAFGRAEDDVLVAGRANAFTFEKRGTHLVDLSGSTGNITIRSYRHKLSRQHSLPGRPLVAVLRILQGSSFTSQRARLRYAILASS